MRKSQLHLIALAFGMFTMGFEDYLFPGLVPEISQALHSTVVATAQGCAIHGLAYILAVPICIFLLSRFRQQQVLNAAIVLFIAGDLLTLTTHTLSIYMIGRLISGIGSGLYLPIAVSTAVQICDRKFLGRTLGLMWSANSLGAVVGVPFGLWVAHTSGFRATLALIIGLSLFVLMALRSFAEVANQTEVTPSLGEQVRLLLDRKVLRVVSVTLLTATGCLGLYTFISQLPIGDEKVSDLAYSFWSIGGWVGSIAIGILLDKFPHPKTIMLTIIAVLLTSILSISLMKFSNSIALLPFFLWGAMGWASVSTQQVNLIRIQPKNEAALIALNSSAVSLGGSLGTALLGSLLAAGLKPQHLPLITAIFLALALASQISLLCRAHPRKTYNRMT